MAEFGRLYLLLTHTGDDTKLAVSVLVVDYDGGTAMYPKDWSRSKSGAGLVVRGTTKRRFIASVLLDDSLSGSDTVTYDTVAYTIANPAQIKACWAATDLKAKSFEDSSFWNAEILCDYSPKVIFEPTGLRRVTQLVMEEL